MSESRQMLYADLGATGTLDPDVLSVLQMVAKARRPQFHTMTPVQARAHYERAAPILDIAPCPVHRVGMIEVPSKDGHPVPVRLYLPSEPSWAHPLPVLIFLHGGGFTVGSPETVDAIARMFCMRAECAVLSVDYRLAPEHKFPTAFDDAYAVLRWAFDEAHAHGFDPDRVAVGGDSAGGTLAAACALAARDAGLPLSFQLLIYPGACARQDTASHFAYADDYLLGRETILWFFNQYIGSPADRDDWRFAPLNAASLKGLAPVWVGMAEFDALVDEGVAYARAMQAAGVPTELHVYGGMVHTFFNMGGFVRNAARAHDDAVAALRRVWRLD